MNTEQVRSYRTRDEDRLDWGPGPWQDETVDKLQWVDAATDLDCLAVRNHFGAWCGYVGVPQSHPLFGQEYDELPLEVDPDVHGGLTFSSLCHESPYGEGFGVCHVPFDGRPEKVWWLGFDCAHGGDCIPGTQAGRMSSLALMAQLSLGRHRGWHPGEETYRDLSYVKAEVTNLAQQLAAVAEGKLVNVAKGG